MGNVARRLGDLFRYPAKVTQLRFSIKALVLVIGLCAIAASFISPLFETSLRESFSGCDMVGDYYLIYGEQEMEITWAIALSRSCPASFGDGQVTLQDGTEITINDDSVTYQQYGDTSTVPLSRGDLHLFRDIDDVVIIDNVDGISARPEIVCFGDSNGIEADVSTELHVKLEDHLDPE